MSDKGSRDELKGNASGSEVAPAIARLCYVDDSRTSAYVVRKLLQPYGYQVDYFQSAEPAFVALIQEDYDLLLTDLKVSSKGMDGDDLIRTIRKSGHAKISSMPIIVITGASDDRVLVEVYDAGANQVMKKPVDAEVLNNHIIRLLPEKKPELKVVQQQGDRDNVVSLTPMQRTNTGSSGEANVNDPVNKPSKSAKQPDSDVPVLDEPAPERVNSTTVDPELDKQALPSEDQPSKTSEETVKEPVNKNKESLLERAVSKKDEQEKIKSDSKAAKEVDVDKSAQKAASIETNIAGNKTDEVIIKSPDSDTSAKKPENEENILSDLEKHTLVIRDRKNPISGLNILGLFNSLVELVGMRNLIQRAVAAVVGIFLVLMVWSIFFDKGLPVKTSMVESGEIYQSITVPGRVFSKQRVNISPAHTGRIVEIYIKEGERVEAGQNLAKMDDRELISRHNQAKAKLADAKESVALAERILKRLRIAYKKGAVARRFVEDAEVDLSSARTHAGIAVEEAKSAKLSLSKQQITAPFSGTITARYAEVGQWVGPSESMFTLVDDSRREIEVRVDAADSMSINVGQVVAVSSDAFPGLEWHESVSRLGTAANNDSLSNSVKVYISLGNDAPSLRFGQQVDADIRTAWNPNTLKIPFEALLNRDGQTVVAVLERGHVKLKPVETGIEDFSMVEIKQGLNPGEVVILSKGQYLQNGDKVYSIRNKQ